MNTLKQIKRIIQLHNRIKDEHTGTSGDLSNELKISQRSVQDYLLELRAFGAIILYDNVRHTYFYANKFDIKFIFEIVVKK